MASVLQQGINAAKAGRMQEALDFLKDAIIEEPQNADVWVWIAAIIDDLDKQEIFLEKALEIDPNNIPAQRGLAYLHQRKWDKSRNNGDQLADHTRPISPFPKSGQVKPIKNDTGWEKITGDDLNDLVGESPKFSLNDNKGEGALNNLPALSPFEIVLLGVVVVVFCFIGLLAASALLKFDLPMTALLGDRPRLSTEPPYPGVFLYVEDVFFDIQEYKGPPTFDVGIPTSTEQRPVIVIWQTEANQDHLNLIYETGDYISYAHYRGKGDSILVRPETNLEDGLYCLQQTGESTLMTNSLYWCFKVRNSGPED